MTDTAAQPLRPILAIGLGACAGAVALLPFPASLAVAVALPAGVAAAWFLCNQPDRWVVALLAAAILLPPLPIPLGDSGPHPSILLAAVGLLMGVWQWREWRFEVRGPARALFAYTCAMLFSLCAAALYSGPTLALASLARALLFGIAVFVFFYVAHGPGRGCVIHSFAALRWIFAAGVAAGLAACIDFYYQLPAPAGFAPQFVWLDTGVLRRAQGFFYEASTLGNCCAFFLVLAAVAFTLPRDQSPIPRVALLAGSAVFAAALVLSYSRASIVNVVVAIGALAMIRRRSPVPLRAIAALGATLVAGAAAVSAFRPAFASLYWERIVASVSFIGTAPDRILSGRTASWQKLADFIMSDPWRALVGVGYKTLPYSDVIGRPVIGDNAYLSALVEMGIAGLLALLALNASILRAAWRAAHHPDRTASFFGAWIFCFWMGQSVQMLSGDLLTYWRVLPLYFWALAVAIRAAHEHPLP